MADAGWVALGGVAVGVVGKGLWDWRLAVGKARFDRDARDDARRDKRLERRDDLQRQTLLDLQQAMTDLAYVTTQGASHDRRARRINERYGSLFWPAELIKGRADGLGRMRLLGSRVRDTLVREGAAAFTQACIDVGNTKTDEEAGSHVNEAVELFNQMQDRAGQLIREMDDL